MHITAERLRALLSYDPETGVFTRAGRPSGSRNMGYIRVKIDGRSYYAHVLAWFYVYGEWRPRGIDHRDGNGFNNRLSNLRGATHAQNCRNRRMRSDNRAGLKGVMLQRSGRFGARIGDEYLGMFDTAEEAHAAYCAAAEKHHGEFARTA